MRSRTVFPEIQALRAVAVGLVLIFHLWPTRLSGGFVGVDVFFVISGYLITGQLARAALRDGRISLVDFYSRRARRLLPAATLVLMVTFIGMFFFLPEARWEETVVQIAASALYVQNWALAGLSVDYLGAENAASPVQHYWSLSIEEQFYLVWPLIVVLALHVARYLRLPLNRILILALVAIFAASLLASILLTDQEPAKAYFVTYTRIWELALGGLLAMNIHLLRVPAQWQRAALASLGLAAIIWSSMAFSSATTFPGKAALVPTIGAAMIILAGDVRLGRFRGVNMPWLGWIGDRSYAIYLWHWPLIVFFTVDNNSIEVVPGIGLLLATLVLSHFSYRYVEQHFRTARMEADWLPLACGAASMAASVAVAATWLWVFAQAIDTHDYLLDPRYPGPAALAASAPVPANVDPIPSSVALKKDLPVVYQKHCHQDQEGSDPLSCVLGDTDASRTIAIVGDSHAAQWVPALELIAKDNGWKLVTFTKSACAFSRVEVLLQGRPYPSCAVWRENVIKQIKTIGTNVMFTSQSRYNYTGRSKMTLGLRSIWQELKDSGVQVVPIRDTPQMPFDPGDCLNQASTGRCEGLRKAMEQEDIYSDAVKYFDDVGVVDLNDEVCSTNVCPAVIGNIVVWRDRHHLTATYARKLAPYLLKQAWRANIGLHQ